MTEQSPAVALSKIGQIFLLAQDLDRAVAFYRDTLGMKLLFQVPRMAFFDCNGVRLMLGIAEKPEPEPTTAILYYVVEDILAAHGALLRRGITVVEEPELVAKMPDHDLWLSFLRDSEGNTFALMSEVRPPAPRETSEV